MEKERAVDDLSQVRIRNQTTRGVLLVKVRWSGCNWESSPRSARERSALIFPKPGGRSMSARWYTVMIDRHCPSVLPSLGIVALHFPFQILAGVCSILRTCFDDA